MRVMSDTQEGERGIQDESRIPIFLVCWGCWNKIAEAGWLKQQKPTFSWVWRLDGRYTGASGWFLLRPVSGFQMAAFSCMVPSVAFRPCLHVPWCVPISSHKDISQMRLAITLQTVLACDFICLFMLGCAPSSCCARAVSSCGELGPPSL